jgi:hypothetical protein
VAGDERMAPMATAAGSELVASVRAKGPGTA